MKASFHRSTYRMFQGDTMTHEVVNLGLRAVNSKDLLCEVGLAHREVIHGSTLEALENVS